MSQQYVIWLSSGSHEVSNTYGYWSGKSYTAQGELIPITDSLITENTKIYSSKARAERALESCLDRGYAYVYGGKVEPIN